MKPRPRLHLLALLLTLLGGCSSDSGGPGGPDPDPDPDPAFDIDIIVFRVWTLETGGVERLRWVGSVDGPLPDSPEPTRWPWVGYARGFRVDWHAYSEDDPIAGTRYRVSQLDSGPWLPVGRNGAKEWGTVSEFQFENLLDAATLPPEGCPEGPDCVGDLRFDSGRHRLQVQAITTGMRELDASLGELMFEINYPPSATVVFDAASGPEDPFASPVAYWTLTDGSQRYVALAEGDTVPSGATLRARVRGRDRLRATTDTDSFCCDERLDASAEEVRFQANTGFVRETARGLRDSLFTFVGAISADSVFTMPLGPFEYSAGFRALDEHDRRGAIVDLDFVVGFPPLLPTAVIEDGSRVLLHPEREPAAGEGEFRRGAAATLIWESGLQDWSEFGSGTSHDGYWYEIPLRFRGEPDPRVLEVSAVPPDDAPVGSLDYSDHVRSFAYELVHERDPLNLILNGPADRYDWFLDADRPGELDLEGARAWRLFIPDLVFQFPQYFNPEPECLDGDFCAIGFYLRERLGEIELRVRSRTTASTSAFHQNSPEARRDLQVDLSESGRFSPVLTRHFEVRLALTDPEGQLIAVWPPASP